MSGEYDPPQMFRRLPDQAHGAMDAAGLPAVELVVGRRTPRPAGALPQASLLRRRVRAAIVRRDVVLHVDGGSWPLVLPSLALALLMRARVTFRLHGPSRASDRWKVLEALLVQAAPLVVDTPADRAGWATVGAEAWCGTRVALPSDEAVRSAMETWPADDDGPRVLVCANVADDILETAVRRQPGDFGLATPPSVVTWAPRDAEGPDPRQPRRMDSPDVLACIAAADLLVLPADASWTVALAQDADRLGTPFRICRVTAAGEVEGADAAPEALPFPRPEPSIPASTGDRGTRTSPALAVVAWTNSTGRTRELAHALGGVPWTFYDLNLTAKPLIPLRYALSGLRMGWRLLRRRPSAVLVANPPIVPAILVEAYRRLTGATVLLDSQTASFGEKASRVGRATLPLHRALSARAACTMVGTEELGQRVSSWGGNPVVFHEAPPIWAVAPPRADTPSGLVVLWIGVFATDEPLAAVLEAARERPDIEFRVTGDLRRAPANAAAAPANVTWLGFVRGRAYPAELEHADITVAMTTDPGSALRGAAEGFYAGRPVITSDVEFLRELFPFAEHATNDADGLLAAIGRIEADWARARVRTERGRQAQLARAEQQLGALRRCMD